MNLIDGQVCWLSHPLQRERESNPAIANHSMHSGCNLICAFSSYIYNILFSIVHCDQTISYLTCYFKKQFIDTENCRPVSLYTYLSHAWVIGIICNSQLNTLRYPIWKQKACTLNFETLPVVLPLPPFTKLEHLFPFRKFRDILNVYLCGRNYESKCVSIIAVLHVEWNFNEFRFVILYHTYIHWAIKNTNAF